MTFVKPEITRNGNCETFHKVGLMCHGDHRVLATCKMCLNFFPPKSYDQIAYSPADDVRKLLDNFPKGERGPAIDEAIRAMYGEESDATKARIAIAEILKEELQ